MVQKMLMAQENSLVVLTRFLQRLSQNATSTHQHINTTPFVPDQYKLFKPGYQENPDASLLYCKVEKDCFNYHV